MPKMKSHKAGAKRFKVTGSGQLMRKQSGRSHLNQKKSSRRKRSLDSYVCVDSTNYKKIQLELPYMKYCRNSR